MADQEGLLLGGGMWDIDIPWQKVATQLLKISCVVAWEDILVKENALASAMIKIFERYVGERGLHGRQNLLVATKLYLRPPGE